MPVVPYPYTGGRIQFVGGIRYYSPNSAVDAVLDLHPQRKNTSNPFYPGQTGKFRVRYRDFVNPRPWNLKFAWTAFIPVVPAQWFDHHTYLGRVLSRFPPIEHFMDEKEKKHGWRIPEQNEWRRLEKDVYDAVVALSAHYHTPCVLPFLPNAIGYTLMYTHKRTLVSRLEEARDWFFVWFGALSYLLTCSRNNPLQPRAPFVKDEQLANVLYSRGVSPVFVDTLLSSLVADPEPTHVRRAGTIIDLSDNPLGRPSIDFFVNWGVPVWYRWRDVEEKASFLCDWRPPAHLLLQEPCFPPSRVTVLSRIQIETAPSEDLSGIAMQASPARSAYHGTDGHQSFFTNSNGVQVAIQSSPTSPVYTPDGSANDACLPSATTAAGGSNSIISAPQEDSASSKEPEWITFFREREDAHAQILKTEKPKSRQARENRMREPATASAKVFEWFRSEKEGVLYERLPVLGKARVETLDGYGEAQKRYDAFFNEWDCCTEWGEDDDTDLGDEYDDYPGKDSVDEDPPSIPSAAASSFVRVTKLPTQGPVSHTEVDEPTEVFLGTSGKTILVPGCPGTPTGVTERHRAARAAKAARVPGRLPGQS